MIKPALALAAGFALAGCQTDSGAASSGSEPAAPAASNERPSLPEPRVSNQLPPAPTREDKDRN